MADNATNIQENICEAISIIAKSAVDKITYDNTIECTIIDDSNKLKGQYRVKNESYSEFDAFSQITTYNKNNSCKK